jgi:hypothetical protein
MTQHILRCERAQQENRIQKMGSDVESAALWTNVGLGENA